VLQIVRNSAHSWLAKNRIAGQLPLDDEELERHDSVATISADDPMLAAAAQIEGEGLRRAIAQLPLEQREVLILREFEELSYRQIADVIGTPLGTVMSRLSRARDQLAAIVRGAAPAAP
jgi:RNA polymerase sigma-70 factor (ECF subfamily)